MTEHGEDVRPLGRRFRMALINVPGSKALFHWWVLYGSVVVDLGFSEAAAVRRAYRFIDGDVRRWNMTQVSRIPTGRHPGSTAREEGTTP